MIIINPGHGGIDPGAVGPAGTKEADIVKIIAQNVFNKISNLGLLVSLTPPPGMGAAMHELQNIINWCKKQGPNIVISIHCNSAANISANGFEIFTYSVGGNSLKLAVQMYDVLLPVIGIKGRGIKTGNFGIIRETERAGAAAVLIELAFISNPVEEKLLLDPAIQEKISNGIVKGVLAYMGIEENRPKTEWEILQEKSKEWAIKNGITTGERPGDNVTRSELWAMLYNYHKTFK